MVSKLNIYLLATLLLAGLAVAVHAADRLSAASNPARTASASGSVDLGINGPPPSENGEAPAAPDTPVPATQWYPDLSDLSVPVQFAFAAARSVAAEGSALRVPIPELSIRATHDLTDGWRSEHLGLMRAANSPEWWTNDSREFGIGAFLRTTIRRLGPPISA